MSWELAERLKERFPDVELFPRPGEPGKPGTGNGERGTGEHPAEGAPVEGAPAAPKRPAHEQPAQYLTPGAYVPAARLLEIGRVLATDPAFGLGYLSFVSAIDRPDANEMEVLYHLYAHRTREELALKVRIPRDDPRLPSVVGIWDGANWHERETFDLFGVIFEGHPHLRRIMMTDDWIGHPLRKDYVYQDPPWLVEIAGQRQAEGEGLGLGERS